MDAAGDPGSGGAHNPAEAGSTPAPATILWSDMTKQEWDQACQGAIDKVKKRRQEVPNAPAEG